MQRIPFGLLRQLIYPPVRSRRPKRPDLFRETSLEVRSKPLFLQLVPASGNLPANDSYRFFVGKSKQFDTAVCRNCAAVVMVHQEHALSEHLRGICKYQVQETIKLLRRDRRCVCCNTLTARFIWGLPICSDNCRTVWMFTLPPAFAQARSLRGNNHA